jgi:protein TonB
LSGKQRINVIFKIDKNGNVTGVRSRAPHPRLEKEAARVINLLPKMKPGRQRGKAVVVPYSLPITFKVQE